jgi:hypothetical protein
VLVEVLHLALLHGSGEGPQTPDVHFGPELGTREPPGWLGPLGFGGQLHPPADVALCECLIVLHLPLEVGNDHHLEQFIIVGRSDGGGSNIVDEGDHLVHVLQDKVELLRAEIQFQDSLDGLEGLEELI